MHGGKPLQKKLTWHPSAKPPNSSPASTSSSLALVPIPGSLPPALRPPCLIDLDDYCKGRGPARQPSSHIEREEIARAKARGSEHRNVKCSNRMNIAVWLDRLGLLASFSRTFESKQQPGVAPRVYSTAKASSSCLINVSSDGRTFGPNFASTLPSRPTRYF